MASVYGVGVMNRYELFADDESDPLDVFKAMEQMMEEKKKTKTADKENNAATKTNVVMSSQKKKVKAPNVKSDAQQQKLSNGTKAKVENVPIEEKPARGQSPRGENRRGRPLGNRNNGGRKFADDRRGKREFDRQSGSEKTGVKPIDKRDGTGSHNWGSHKDLIEEVEKTIAVEEPRAEEQVENEKVEEVAPPVEEESKQLTLEEWKASKNRLKPQYKLRKAGEGEDLTQWKNMYELNKKKEGDESEEDEEYDPMNFPQRVGRQVHVRDINFYFNDARRGGAFRGRGGRGGRRGGGDFRQRDVSGSGGGGNQSDGGEQQQQQPSHQNVPAPRVDDERDFPSLA